MIKVIGNACLSYPWLIIKVGFMRHYLDIERVFRTASLEENSRGYYIVPTAF